MLYDPKPIRKRIIYNYFLPHKEKTAKKFHKDFLNKYFDKNRFIKRGIFENQNNCVSLRSFPLNQDTNMHVEQRDSILNCRLVQSMNKVTKEMRSMKEYRKVERMYDKHFKGNKYISSYKKIQPK